MDVEIVKDKKIYTKYYEGEEVTCTEICTPRSKEERSKEGNTIEDVHYCCRFCDKNTDCNDVCSFVEDKVEDDGCEFDWCVERCYNCGKIILLDEDTRTMTLYNNSSSSSKDIILCENCLDEDVSYYKK